MDLARGENGLRCSNKYINGEMSVPGHSERSSLTQLSASGTTGSHFSVLQDCCLELTSFKLAKEGGKGALNFPSDLLRKKKKALGALSRRFLRARPGQRLSYRSRGARPELGMGGTNCKVN